MQGEHANFFWKSGLAVNEADRLGVIADFAVKIAAAAGEDFAAQGLSVSVQQVKPENLRYKTLAKINGSEVQTIENDA